MVDPEGKPVAGADVRAVKLDDLGADPQPADHVRTDAEGRSCGRLRSQSKQRLLASNPAGTTACRIVAADPHAGTKRTSAIEVALKPAMTITGRALIGWQPIAGSGVMLMEQFRPVLRR